MGCSIAQGANIYHTKKANLINGPGELFMSEHPPLTGTPFQLLVWNALKEIPRGEVRTYKQLAVQIGRPQSIRAVANACGKNPYIVKIPCHRVIRSDGGLGGYSGPGGIEEKRRLLKQEGVNIPI